jgi:ketosteroid isomerase-like protein
MDAKENKAVMQRFFDSFRTGQLDLASYVTTDVEWTVVADHAPVTQAVIPWIGTHKGLDGLQKFFGELLENIQVVEFEDRDYIAEDDRVAVFGYFKYCAIPTGNLMETDWAIRIQMRDGRIARYHFFENTFAIANAFRTGGSWEIENSGSKRTVS